MMEKDSAKAAADLRAAMPRSHVAILATLRTSITVGRYFLCHAGVRPGVPLERQGAVDNSDGVVFCCTLSGSGADRWLEVPAWMFDRARCLIRRG